MERYFWEDPSTHHVITFSDRQVATPNSTTAKPILRVGTSEPGAGGDAKARWAEALAEGRLACALGDRVTARLEQDSDGSPAFSAHPAGLEVFHTHSNLSQTRSSPGLKPPGVPAPSVSQVVTSISEAEEKTPVTARGRA